AHSSGHFSGHYVQAQGNMNQHYLDEEGSEDCTSEHETTLAGPASTNVADLQNQCAGETRWAGSIPVRLRYSGSEQGKYFRAAQPSCHFGTGRRVRRMLVRNRAYMRAGHLTSPSRGATWMSRTSARRNASPAGR